MFTLHGLRRHGGEGAYGIGGDTIRGKVEDSIAERTILDVHRNMLVSDIILHGLALSVKKINSRNKIANLESSDIAGNVFSKTSSQFDVIYSNAKP